MPESEPRRGRGSLLGAVAYLLVPGERRKAAGTHFRRAGFEALRGVGALVRPGKPPEGSEEPQRERIRID